MRFPTLISVIFLLASCNGTPEVKPKKAPPKIVERSEQKAADNPQSPAYPPQFKIPVIVKAKGEYSIVSKVDGLIEGTADWKPGMKFKKGDLLIQINNREAFSKLSAGKKQLSSLARQSGVGLQNAEDREALDNFVSGISVTKLLPSLPEIAAGQKELSDLYSDLSLQEKRMADYFIVAEEDGVIIERKAGPGKSVKQGDTILLASKTGKKTIRLPKDFTYTAPVMLWDSKKNVRPVFTIKKITNGEAEVPSEIKPGNYTLLRVVY